MKDDKLRHEIAEIIKNGVTYSPQTHSVIIHGAIEELLKVIHRQENLALDIYQAIIKSETP